MYTHVLCCEDNKLFCIEYVYEALGSKIAKDKDLKKWFGVS